MSSSLNLSHIKRSQKEAELFKHISAWITYASVEDKNLSGLFVSKVELTRDKGVCYVYFHMPDGEAKFKERLHIITLYKPSLRKALADVINARYTPEIIFKYDKKFVKKQRIEEILEKIKNEPS